MSSPDSILTLLRTDPTSWASLLSFSPTLENDASTDANLHNRYCALLGLHSYHQPTPKGTEDLELTLYLLDEEIRYHQKADHYHSSLSLACYLIARYQQPVHLWAIWAARETNYDASKCVDSHYLYYSAAGMDQAKAYVQGCHVVDVVTGGGAGRSDWWKWVVEEVGGDEGKAFEKVKSEVLQRIEQDRQCGITDEKITKFVEGSWRSETSRWGESLLPEEY